MTSISQVKQEEFDLSSVSGNPSEVDLLFSECTSESAFFPLTFGGFALYENPVSPFIKSSETGFVIFFPP